MNLATLRAPALLVLSATVLASGDAGAGAPPLILPNHHDSQVAMPRTTWQDSRRQGIAIQSDEFSCGAAALSNVLSHFYDYALSETQILQEVQRYRHVDTRNEMLSTEDLRRVAASHGFLIRVRQVSINALITVGQARKPVMLLTNEDGDGHFSVLAKVTKSKVFHLIDSRDGRMELDYRDFGPIWLREGSNGAEPFGIVLWVTPNADKPLSTRNKR